MTGKLRNMVERDGRFFARLVVPLPLRPIVGKTELRTPLGGDRRLAVRNLYAEVARLQDVLTAAEAQLGSTVIGKRPFSMSNAAKVFFAHLEQDDEDDRNRPRGVEETQEAARWGEDVTSDFLFRLRWAASGKASDYDVESIMGFASRHLNDRGNSPVKFETREWRERARELAKVWIEHLERSIVRDEGGTPGEPAHPLLQAPIEPEPVPFQTLIDGYYGELAKSGRGHEAYRKAQLVFRRLKEFLQHDDAAKVTDRDLVRWKEELQSSSLSARTLKLTYVTAIRSVFKWALEHHKLDKNPALDFRMKAPKPKRQRDPGFNQTEALAILKAANVYKPALYPKGGSRVRSHLVAAKRWVPWICCYTGCRVAEATFLRKEDIRQSEDGIWFFHFVPQKGEAFREVPLHEHLIAMGLLNFVHEHSGGHMFCSTPRAIVKKGNDPSRDPLRKPNHPAKNAAQKISDWVRSLDVIPAELQPNHAWRHRFKTQRRSLGLDKEIIDAIQGHATTGVSEDYGDVSLAAKRREIDRIPRFEVKEPENANQW